MNITLDKNDSKLIKKMVKRNNYKANEFDVTKNALDNVRNNVRYGIWKDGKIDDSLNGIGDFKKYMKKEFFKYRKYFKKDFISNYVKNINFEEYFYTIVKVKI